MRWVVRLAAVLVVMSSVASGQDELSARVFTLQHRDLAEAAQTVQTMLSDVGSLHLRPARRQLTVQDRKPVIERVERFLEQFDVPQTESYRLLVRLIDAFGESPGRAEQETDLEPDLRDKLQRTFHLQHYTLLAASEVQGEYGEDVRLDLGERYGLEFVCTPLTFSRVPVEMGRRRRARLQRDETATAERPRADGSPTSADPESKTPNIRRVRLRHVVLSRKRISTSDHVHFEAILRTGVVLTEGQRVVLGTMSSEGADRALVLVIEMPRSHDVEDH